MSSTTWWNQRRLDHAIRRWERRGLESAAEYLKTFIVATISTPGIPLDRRSLPGEPPRYETRDLIRSWTYFVDPSSAYAVVYSSLDYSYYLEVGAQATFGYVAPRPTIRRSLLSEELILYDLLTQPLSWF
jgi:hypothetical protein